MTPSPRHQSLVTALLPRLVLFLRSIRSEPHLLRTDAGEARPQDREGRACRDDLTPGVFSIHVLSLSRLSRSRWLQLIPQFSLAFGAKPATRT